MLRRVRMIIRSAGINSLCQSQETIITLVMLIAGKVETQRLLLGGRLSNSGGPIIGPPPSPITQAGVSTLTQKRLPFALRQTPVSWASPHFHWDNLTSTTRTIFKECSWTFSDKGHIHRKMLLWQSKTLKL